jgi:hypothetical protein
VLASEPMPSDALIYAELAYELALLKGDEPVEVSLSDAKHSLLLTDLIQMRGNVTDMDA